MIIPTPDDVLLARIWELLQRRPPGVLDQIEQILRHHYASWSPVDRAACDACSAGVGEWCDESGQTLLTAHPGRGERLDRPAAVLAAAQQMENPGP